MSEDIKNNEILTEEEKLKQENASYEAGIVPSLKDTEISTEVQNSFLDYAMSVIVSRAIPDVRDGLKPVHRRCIYGMYDAGYTSDKPFVKSARIVGEVMGKYHPHGDAAIYNTIVRLAQPFSMRYILADGHGNFGSMDGDEAAAMRYTECRMSKIASEMVRDINLDTVNFVPNYDGSLEEPEVLPSKIPNLLINGSDGIAVGMATKMPPHNLRDIIDGIIAFSKNRDISVEELMKIVKGPDFPTGGIIYGLGGVRDAYEKGRGTFRLRAKTEIQEMSNGKGKIIISEIPYQVNKAALVSKIGELARDKVIDGITSIKDYSKGNVNIEIECRRDVVPQVVLNQLFKNTQLEVSYGVINLCITNGAPKVLSLKELISDYLDHQINVEERKIKFLKKKDEDRKHIVEGLLKVHDNVDEVVHLAKNSANPQDFSNNLMEKFGLSEPQAKAVVAMTLGRLTGLETQKLLDEKELLINNINRYTTILSSYENLLAEVIKELEEIKKKYGDDRRSIISTEITSLDDEDLIPEEDIVITLTEKGYIKRMSNDEFRAQNRGGTGVKGMTVYEDDEVKLMVSSKTHTDILFFTSKGRVYRRRGHEILAASRQGKGIPVGNLIDLEKDERVVSLIDCDEYNEKYLFFATKKGIVKRTKLEEFQRINANGKYAITFKEDDSLLNVCVTDGDALIALATNKGMLCLFKEDDVRAMGRTAAGVKGINAKGGEVVALSTSISGDKVFVLSENGLGKLSPLEDYRQTKRGAGGVITIKTTDKTGLLVGMNIVKGDEDVVVITNAGTVIRTPLNQVRECGRNSQGVKVINLRENELVSGFTIIPHATEEDTLENNENTDNSSEKPLEVE